MVWRAFARRLAFGLVVASFWAGRTAQWIGSRVASWSADDISRFQRRLSFRIAIVSVVLLMGIRLGHWDRLQVDGPLSDSLVKEVLAQREVRKAPELRPAGAKPGHYERHRCVVPIGASAAGLTPYLNATAQASASAWIGSTLPGLGGDWWMLDTLEGRISNMSRMDKSVLQPHSRMKEAQCVAANAMKWINAGQNDQGVLVFQVVALSRSVVF